MSGRLARLDAVRALAVLLVLAYHLSYRVPPVEGDLIGRGLRVMGWLGVDLFFALSGFLIASILAKPAGRGDLQGFARKRIWRIFPVLILAVAVFAAADLALAGGQALPLLWIPLTALNGYLVPVLGFDTVPFTIVWSLSVELTAYGLFAWLAWANWARFQTWLWAMVIAAPLLRVALLALGWEDAVVAIFPPARLDALALGALAALGAFGALQRIPHAAWIWGFATIALLVGARFAAWVPHLTETVGLSLFGLVAALWVAALAQAGREGRPAGWALQGAAKIGLVSYFIYLFHLFVIEGLMVLGSGALGFWANFVLSSAVVYGLAWISWRWLEAPMIASAGRTRSAA